MKEVGEPGTASDKSCAEAWARGYQEHTTEYKYM